MSEERASRRSAFRCERCGAPLYWSSPNTRISLTEGTWTRNFLTDLTIHVHHLAGPRSRASGEIRGANDSGADAPRALDGRRRAG
eukprot:985891-Prymnesium_polylepis.3